MIILKKICHAIFFIKPQTNVLDLFFKKQCCSLRKTTYYTLYNIAFTSSTAVLFTRIAIAMSYTYHDRFYDTTGTPGYSCADSVKSIFSTPQYKLQKQLFCLYPTYSQKCKYTNIT